MIPDPIVCPSCRKEVVLKSDGLCPHCMHDLSEQPADPFAVERRPTVAAPVPAASGKSGGKGLWGWLGTGLVVLLIGVKIAARVERAVRPQAEPRRAGQFDPAERARQVERQQQAELQRQAEQIREAANFNLEQQRHQQVREAMERADRQKWVAPGPQPPGGPRAPRPPVPLGPRVPAPGPRPY